MVMSVFFILTDEAGIARYVGYILQGSLMLDLAVRSSWPK